MSDFDSMRRAYIMLARDGEPNNAPSEENRGMVFINRPESGADQIFFSRRKSDGTYEYTQVLDGIDETTIFFSLAAKQVAGDPISFTDGTPTLTVGSAAGTTGAVSSGAGHNSAYAFVLTPGGTGIAAGKIVSVAFSTARADANSYVVHVSARNSAAGAVQFYTTNRTSSGFDLNVVAALTSGTAYNIGFSVLGF